MWAIQTFLPRALVVRGLGPAARTAHAIAALFIVVRERAAARPARYVLRRWVGEVDLRGSQFSNPIVTTVRPQH